MPPAAEANTADVWTGRAVCSVSGLIWKLAVARTPLPMTLAFMPYATQVVPFPLVEHNTVLLAPVRLGPAKTLKLVRSERA